VPLAFWTACSTFGSIISITIPTSELATFGRLVLDAERHDIIYSNNGRKSLISVSIAHSRFCHCSSIVVVLLVEVGFKKSKEWIIKMMGG
jgi:hypothetical protein